MERLMKRCGNNPAVPTGFDLDFIFDLDDKEDKGLQAVFDRLCELEEKIESGELVEVVRCKDCRWFNKSGYEEDNEHEEDLSLHMGFCLHWRRGTQACRFCSYGEMK